MRCTGDKQWVLPETQPLSAVEFARRQNDALGVLKTEMDPVEREVLGLSQPSGLAVAELGDTTYIVILRGTDRVIELDPDVVQTALSAPSLQFRTNDPVVEDFGRLWRTARNFNLRQPPTRISVAPKALAAALAAAHHRDMRLVRHIAERVTVGDQRGHRDPRCLRVAISTANHQQNFGNQLAVFALPPGDPDDVNVQFVSRPAVTEGAALYEAAFGPNEPKTDFYEAPALSVIASVLGFVDDEIELVP